MPYDKHKHDYDPAVYTHLEGFFSHFADDKYTRFITRPFFQRVGPWE